MSFWSIFVGFISDALNSAVNEILVVLENVMGNILHATFFIEQLPGLDQTILSTSSVTAAFNVLYAFLVYLLTAKLLWKGIKVYILWRDGEAETPPGEMLLSAGFAFVVAVAFPLLYEISIEVVEEILKSVTKAVFSNGNLLSGAYISMIINAFSNIQALPFTILILGLVYVILFIYLMFIMLKQGVELLVFRLGVPIAVLGLVDSDGGIWKTYSQTLYRQLAVALIRHFCLYVGTRMIVGLSPVGIIVGIAFEIVAIGMPKILSQILASQYGGGLAQKAQTIGVVVRLLAR